MRVLKSPLDVALIVIAVLSLAAILLAREDSFLRDALCLRVRCVAWSHAHAWLETFYGLGVGSFISLIFYGLVVRLPEHQKRQRINKSFARYYQEFKEDCIVTMLTVADGTFEWGLHETLVDQEKFREYFHDKVSSSQDRWDAFHNKLDDYNLQELITNMEILRGEIAFVLMSIDTPDEKPFEFLKRLSSIIVQMKNTKLDYDSTKRLGNFLWDVFAGFSLVSGYRQHDIIAEMIKAI
jgi:hypothetical protein